MNATIRGETWGALYIATGSRWVEEAAYSARRFADHHPSIPITLWTDEPATLSEDAPFSQIGKIDDPLHGPADSIIRPEMITFDRVLYLDTDTLVLGDLTPVLEVLDRWDIAVRPSPGRFPVPGLPVLITEFNTGVVALRRTPRVLDFLLDWRMKFFAEGGPEARSRGNQAGFSRALHDSELRVWPLPPEYNLRLRQAEYLDGPVRVLHGRHRRGLDRFGERLNRRTGPRLMWRIPTITGGGPVFRLPCPRLTVRQHIRRQAAGVLPKRVKVFLKALRR